MTYRLRRWGPGLLLLAPSLIVLGIFVYGLIGYTVNLSLQDRHNALPAEGYAGISNYTDLFTEPTGRFRHNLWNLAVFTVVFMGGTLLLGLLWAFLLDRRSRAEGFFRTVYLFPMAVSFVASGVVWRWLMNSGQGPSDAGGINRLFEDAHLGFLENRWWTAPTWGMAAMAMPAIWQLSGYIMALFIAGFRGIPGELREAAVMDGASTFQLYRRVLFPQLTPVALSALIITGHMSMKMFDLIMSVSGPQWITEVPSVYVWQTLLTYDYAKAAAIAVFLLVVVAFVIVPYLVHVNRAEKRS